VDDIADVVATGEGEEGIPVGDVEGFHGHPAGEERRDLDPAVRGDDHLVSEVDERAGGVGADHAQPAGDEDHRTTSSPPGVRPLTWLLASSGMSSKICAA
jgi:hypothetical protein